MSKGSSSHEASEKQATIISLPRYTEAKSEIAGTIHIESLSKLTYSNT